MSKYGSVQITITRADGCWRIVLLDMAASRLAELLPVHRILQHGQYLSGQCLRITWRN